MAQTYTYEPECSVGRNNACASNDGACFEGGVEGRLYFVLLDGEIVGETCSTPDRDTGLVTPELVRTAFRGLSWPSSELVVQPPGGRTLVNFDTNVFTPNSDPTRRVVRLLGQRVTVEARPVAYRWVWGDGTSTRTAEPGRAYPHLDVTHRYLRAESVQVRVDTVYAGRYRLGSGRWRAIEGTLTVPGDPVVLEVVEASPVLAAG